MYWRIVVKLVEAKVYGFGKWIDQEFNFESDYQVIFGSNEAGKTTLLNFIKSILFGFASARGDNKYQQYKPKNSSNYGGELTFEAKDKSHWTVKRVDGKGNGEVTLFHDGQVVPDTLMGQIVGNFTKDDFENTHIFDDQSILSIYSLDENKLETEIMSIGAVGSKDWLKAADNLNSDAENIYRPRGQKQPLVVKLKRRDKLLEEKAEIENQQTAYQRVKDQLSLVNRDFDDNERLLKQADEAEDSLRNLDKKWSRYEQFQKNKHPNESSIQISNDDWEEVLKANQELSTLKETQTTNKVSELNNVEKNILKNYNANKSQLDYIRNQKFELQNLQFHRDDMNSKLLKVDTQVDQLFKNHPQLAEDMLPLTSGELDQLTPQTNSEVNIPLIICAVAIVLAFVTSNPLRFLFIVVAALSVFWYWYQKKNLAAKNNLANYAFLKQKGYENLSRETIINLQETVIALDNFHTSQRGLVDGIKSIEVDLNKWRKILLQLNVLDESYKSDKYNEQIEKYFAELDQIKAKADLAQQNQAVTQEMADNKTQHLAELKTKIEQILAKYKIVNLNSFVQIHTQQVENVRAVNQFKQDKDFLGSDLAQLQKYPDRETLSNELSAAVAKKNELSDKNNQLSRQMGSLKEQMQQIFDNTQYQRIVSELAQNQEDILENYDEWLAEKLASDWIKEMLNIATENRYPKMIQKATQYFALLTDNNYVKIDFNDKDIMITSADKNLFDVHELSKATTIQLYLSLRLAFVTEISDLIKLPILIDDAFVDFDISRTENVFKLIQEISKSNQVIYVTANEPKVPIDHILELQGGEEIAEAYN
ncbi:hypothetical protein FHL06_04070 [Lactobacillus halodurans]|uniref:YhaN AAA domain-containing protein n=1 Tax=Companilactobacillus halodurans TaxID=2584183 RepID=A0A5P0ZMX0_9LACO|nr:hypothetical protein [Companilactobacillus halodurans]